MPSQTERRDQEETQRALLATEAALLAALLAAVSLAWKRGVLRRKSARGALNMAALILAIESQEAILTGRLTARRKALDSLAKILNRHGLADAAKKVKRIRVATTAAEAKRAAKIGESLAASWRASAKKTLDKTPKASRTAAAKAVAKAERFRIEMVAATESSRVFNETREAAYETTARELDPGDRERPWRLWDASLDKRTCPICDRAHGSMVKVGERFRAGSPGAVHPSCRCLDLLVFKPRNFVGTDTSPRR